MYQAPLMWCSSGAHHSQHGDPDRPPAQTMVFGAAARDLIDLACRIVMFLPSGDSWVK